MFTKASKIALILVFTISIVTAGCSSHTKNQVKQQTTNMQQAPNNVNMQMDNRFDIAQAAADRIVRLQGVKGANVIVTKHKAYVAAVVNRPAKQISRELEAKMANEVRAMDPTIQHVYVSTNPEFVDRVKMYVSAAKNGRQYI